MDYSIHGMLRVRSNVDIPVPGYFRVKKLDGKPDLLVWSHRKLNFQRDKSNEMLMGNYYFWGGGKKIFVDYDLMNAKLSVEDLFGKTKIECTNSLKRFCTEENWQKLIFAVLSIKMIQKGYTFMHAGGLTHHDGGILIAGMQDTGKTSTVLPLLDGKEFKLLGDDFVILDSGRAYAYPKEIRLSPRTLRGCLESSALKEKAMKNRFISMFMERFLKRDITRLVQIPREYIAEKCDVEKIFILSGYGKEHVERINSSEAFNVLSTLSMQMPNLLETYLDIYYHIFHVEVFRFLEEKNKIIEKTIKSAECFKVTAPRLEGYSLAIKKVLS